MATTLSVVYQSPENDYLILFWVLEFFEGVSGDAVFSVTDSLIQVPGLVASRAHEVPNLERGQPGGYCSMMLCKHTSGLAAYTSMRQIVGVDTSSILRS